MWVLEVQALENGLLDYIPALRLLNRNLDKLVNLISLDLLIYKIVPPSKNCGKELRLENYGPWAKCEPRMVSAF